MKKFLVFSLISLCLFASCTKHDVTNMAYEEYAKSKFDYNFNQTFGESDPTHDWGFSNVQVLNIDLVTRGANVNRNQWSDLYDVPANVTDAEKELVKKWFSVNRQNYTSKTVNWKNYFVYQVYKGEQHYTDGAGGDLLGSDKMNHLQAVFPDGTMEHINDFNTGTQTASWQTIEGATLMLNSTTHGFAYHNSTDSKYHNEYIIVPGEEISPSLKGFYYVGFDFYAHGTDVYPDNHNMDVDRNFIFNDWILRISPAVYNTDGAVRIIAEDLGGATSDFDYNDVVFDAKIANVWDGSSNVLSAFITIRAAGGTLPLTVAGKEVHELFGVEVNTMVNTGAGPELAPVSFQYVMGPADWNVDGTGAVKAIPIVVTTSEGTITLDLETGKAPEKIAVKPSFVWSKEYVAIYKTYPLFKDWVKDKTVVWY